MIPPVFVINLDRQPERLAAIGSRLDDLRVHWSRHNSVDATETDGAERELLFGCKADQGRFPATQGDIACTLSHMRLWQSIAEGRDPVVLILEDDSRVSRGLIDWMQRGPDLMARHSIGVLKLEAWEGPQRSRRIVAGRRLEDGVWRLESSHLGSAAYLITKEAAEALLKHGSPRMPVDHLLFSRRSPMRRALKPAFVSPAPVVQDFVRFPSGIADSRPRRARAVIDRLWRGWAHAQVTLHRAEWVHVIAQT